jgi:hypothetical protein
LRLPAAEAVDARSGVVTVHRPGFRRTHGSNYGFTINDRYLSASGRGTATVLEHVHHQRPYLSAGRDVSGDVRVSVRVDTAAPVGPDSPVVSPPPEGTTTIVTVTVQSP